MLNKFAPFPWGLGAAGLPAAILSPPPAMTGMSPGTGIPDTPVTITGSGFGSMTGTIAVHGQAATVTSWTTTQIVFRVPAQASYPDTGTVLLTTAAGRTESSHTFTTFTLGSTVIADGATYGYRFDEASGNLIDFVGGGSNLTVATQVTRGVAGPNQADLKAYQFTGAAGAGAPSYGHCEGSRPTTDSLTKVTYEAIVKANANGANIAWLAGLWVGVVSMFALGTDAAGDANGYIAAGGGHNLKFVAPGGLIPAGYNHYVWLCDGARMKTYLNGALVNDAAAAYAPGDAALAADRLVAMGGTPQVNNSSQCQIDFFAAYHNVALTAVQVAAHFALSGC